MYEKPSVRSGVSPTLYSAPHNHFFNNLLYFLSPPHTIFTAFCHGSPYTFSVASHSTPHRHIALAWSQQTRNEKLFLFACHTYFPFFFVAAVRVLLVRLPGDYFWLLNCGWLQVDGRGWHDDGKNVYSVEHNTFSLSGRFFRERQSGDWAIWRAESFR